MDGGRGHLLEKEPAAPTVCIRLGSETFWRLGCGRVVPEGVAGRVEGAGDHELGRRVLAEMNFMV
jgi:hypothetical protein